MAAIAEYFNWTKSIRDLTKRFAAKNITLLTAEGIVDDAKDVIKNLKNKDARIMFVVSRPDAISYVLCEAYKKQYYGPKYVWVFPGWYPKHWYMDYIAKDINCSSNQIYQVIQNYLSVYQFYPINNKTTISGRSAAGFQEYFHKFRNISQNDYLKGYVYDSVWTLALALNQTDQQLTLSGGSLLDLKYQNNRKMRIISEMLDKTNFVGITGQINFNGADRESNAYIYQFLGNKSDNYTVQVGIYQRKLDTIEWDPNQRVQWLGDRVPVSHVSIETETISISIPALIAFTILSGIGILFCIGLIAFTLNYRHDSIIVFGIDSGVVPLITVPAFCTVKIWLLCIGFTFAFGALFAKTWRIHKIFTCKTRQSVVIKDWHLLTTVFQLLIIDVIILLCWTIIDPMQLKHLTITTQINQDESSTISRQLQYYCSCNQIVVWMAIVFGYKFLLLLIGSFLAYETRNVTIPALNDTKFIGFSIYNVTLLAAVGSIISFVVRASPTTLYVLHAILIFICSTTTLMFIFIPKIYQWKLDRKHAEGASTGIIHSSVEPIGCSPGSNNSSIVMSRQEKKLNAELLRTRLQESYKHYHELKREIDAIRHQLAILDCEETLIPTM
ncbi:uncharacterized protein TRIADDRAFT_56610 [Trichoplax adhaerens]|uniref:G-protein coupled receptors family 3 profile domain-containing protein n=1 Tax=Trichoplax adhaerens TaxID=10228 RepID=B3RYM6_TRIAD|nr:hypothetical protein TRIADDRAFT_56610 [Trichoplax adhaerens]EDV25067.1 hypothetical protein TRIADDRAFT_56610 [Trichoplax adhaerens]|eukprot:XP_002112957.1 hypothetical protein TRIADDRAFT_56610 [Trichoplax adhaerens]